MRHGPGALLAVAVVVGMLGGCGVLLPLPMPMRPSGPTPPAAPSITSAPSTAPRVAPAVVQPVVPGWSPVRSLRVAAIYDVPPDWTVLTEDTFVGFERGQQRVGGTGAAEFGEGACGGSNNSLAVAVMKHSQTDDLADASRTTARVWADLAYRDDAETPSRLRASPVERITTASGKPGAIVKVTATLASATGPCGLTTGTVWAVSSPGFSGESGPTAVLVIVADTGVPGAASETDIRQSLRSLRPF